MCAWMPKRDSKEGRLFTRRPTKRSLDDIQFERQVTFVCLGIEHLIKRRRAAAASASASAVTGGADKQGMCPVKEDCHHDNYDHERVCRLCESTLRLLSIARAHSSRKHEDGRNCEACRMWATVRARCVSLRILNAPADGTPTLDGILAAIKSAGTAGTAGSSRPAVFPEESGLACE